MENRTKLHLALDLGNDSLKIAYAYSVDGKGTEYGKLTSNDSSIRVAFPALAYYDDEKEKWIYGEQVDKLNTSSFVKVVKIKELLSLLLSKSNAEYYDKHDFPKFFFPRVDVNFNDFGKAIAEDKTFKNLNTPRSVCEGFFAHVKSLIIDQIRILSKKRGIRFDDSFTVSIVHPPKVGKEYVNELSRLCEKTFSQTPKKILSSTKAIGMFAKYRGIIGKGDSLLIFDMGEEDISVSKVFVSENDDLYVDGVEGHMEALHIGGINVDYAIAEHIENAIHERDTVGTPSSTSGKPGHIYEDALISKQYLFMKGVKKAKTVLSSVIDDDSVFDAGAPVGIYYEVYVQRNLSRDELSECLGTNSDTGLANNIAKYILNELKLPLNRGFTSNKFAAMSNPALEHGFVVLSGGLSETYSLKEYLINKIKGSYPEIDVISFTENQENDDGFSILPHESSAYSPAIGGALVALRNDEVKTVLSLSYGTWVNCNKMRCLYIFVDRGQVLDSDNVFTIDYGFSGTVRGERLYSTLVTTKDIEAGVFKGHKLDIQISEDGKRYLRIGNEHNDPYRDIIKDKLMLEIVAGGDTSEITANYRGSEVTRIWDEKGKQKTYITISQGIQVDDNGRISPTYRVHRDSYDQKIKISCINSQYSPSNAIKASELKIIGPEIAVDSEQD